MEYSKVLLVSTIVCSCNDPSRHLVEKGGHQVKACEGSEVDEQFVVHGQFEAAWKV